MRYLLDFKDFILNEKISPKIRLLKKHLTTHYKTKDKELRDKDSELTGKKIGVEGDKSLVRNIFDLVKGYYQGKKIDYSLPGYYFYEYDSTLEDVYLIHFGGSAKKIYESQEFLYGPSDVDKISQAHLSPDKRDIKVPYGYNFAFTFSDVIKYGLGYLMNFKFLKVNQKGNANLFNLGDLIKVKNKSMYGDMAVIFKVESAIRIYAPMDKQYQIIFWSKDAKNINLIVNEDDVWKIKDKHQKDSVFENDNLSKLLIEYRKDYNKYKKYLK